MDPLPPYSLTSYSRSFIEQPLLFFALFSVAMGFKKKKAESWDIINRKLIVGFY